MISPGEHPSLPTREQIVDRAIHDLRNACGIILGNLELLDALRCPGCEKPLARALSVMPRFETVILALSEAGSKPPSLRTTGDKNA